MKVISMIPSGWLKMTPWVFMAMVSLLSAQTNSLFINDSTDTISVDYGQSIEMTAELWSGNPAFTVSIFNETQDTLLHNMPMMDNSPADLDLRLARFNIVFPLSFNPARDGDFLIFKLSQDGPASVLQDSVIVRVIRVIGGVISGNVALSQAAGGATPLPGIQVQATPGPTGSATGGIFSAVTEADGRFFIEVPEKDSLYHVSVIVPQQYYTSKAVYDGVIPGTNTVTFTLNECQGRVFGHATGSGQTPVSGIQLSLYIGDSSNGGAIYYPTNASKTVETDSLGIFSFYFNEITTPVHVRIAAPRQNGFVPVPLYRDTVLTPQHPSAGPLIFLIQESVNMKPVIGRVQMHSIPDQLELRSTLSVYRNGSRLNSFLTAGTLDSLGSMTDYLVFNQEQWLDSIQNTYQVDFPVSPDSYSYIAVLRIVKDIYHIDTFFVTEFRVAPDLLNAAFNFNLYYVDGKITNDTAAAVRESFQPRRKEWTMAAYPNPFSTRTAISFSVPPGFSGKRVSLKIYDASGRSLREWERPVSGAGGFFEIWDGRNRLGQASGNGVYFCELRSGEKNLRTKLFLVR